MEQFKKWLRKDSIKSGWLYDEEAEKQREKGWRGALEFVKEKLNYDIKPEDMKHLIEKELKDE